ncbi:MAG: hypothetical protein RKO24_11240 [Candidatus Competibacter sp.]|nr:hypothetical protein [Candidatus Competibacter sp.]
MNGIEKGRLDANVPPDWREPANEVFSEAWMLEYARLWNAEQAMVRELTRQRFTAVVGYGFPDAAEPKSMLVVARGMAEHAGRYDGRELDWDLRAAPADWACWLSQGFDLSGILVAVGTQRLQIRKGDHKRILRKPPLVGALLRAFSLMPEVRV